MTDYKSTTEIAIHLIGAWRGDEYQMLQNQLNYELNHGVLKNDRV
jgi:hypothetical protein